MNVSPAWTLIQMGARPYSPLLGRFLSVDPEEGGANDYDYTSANPINPTDLDGKGLISWIKKNVRKAGRWIKKNRGLIATVVATGVCVAPVVGWASCGVAQAAAFGVRSQQKIQQNGWRNSKKSIIADGLGTLLTVGLTSSLRYVKHARMTPWVQNTTKSATWLGMSRYAKGAYNVGLNGANWIKAGGCLHRGLARRKPC